MEFLQKQKQTIFEESEKEEKIKYDPETIHGPEESYIGMAAFSRELVMNSKYKRLKEGEREKIISPEGEEFIIRKLTNPEDPLIKKLHNFMVREFGEEEAEALYWLRHQIAENLNQYHVVEKEGKIIGFSNTRLLELEQASGEENQSKESILTIWHISVDKKFRNKGLASELYQSFYSDVLDEARSKGRAIRGIMGEAVPTVESFLNRMGRKRIYYEDENGNVHEVPYMCPPVDVSDSGEIREEPVPDHFMIRLTEDRQELNKEEFLRMVHSIYIKEYVADAENYDSQEAYEKSKQYNENLLKSLAETLSHAKNGKIFFLSARERESKRRELYAQKKELYEIVKNDEGE